MGQRASATLRAPAPSGSAASGYHVTIDGKRSLYWELHRPPQAPAPAASAAAGDAAAAAAAAPTAPPRANLIVYLHGLHESCAIPGLRRLTAAATAAGYAVASFEQVRTRVCACVRACVRACACGCANVCARVRAHVPMPVCACASMFQCLCVRARARQHQCRVHVRMYRCVSARMYKFLCVCARAHVSISVCRACCVCMYHISCAMGLQLTRRACGARATPQVGHGRSHGAAHGRLLTLEALLADTTEMVDFLVATAGGEVSFWLVGHSMGGALCAVLGNAVAARHGAAFRGAVLLSPFVAVHLRDELGALDRAAISCLGGTGAALGPTIVTATDFGAANVAAIEEYDGSTVTLSDGSVRVANYTGAIIMSTLRVLFGLRDAVHVAIPTIAFPFLVMQGAADATVSPAGAAALVAGAATAADAKALVEVPGGSHQLLSEPAEISDGVVARIVEYLGTVRVVVA
jgi:alpha-beta hydrolase superfamily lysophospholipase